MYRRNELVGYHVESVGGPTGTVDPATRHARDQYLVVNAALWPFRHLVVVPAGAVNCVDANHRRVWVERDRDAVRAAPTFDPARYGRAEHGNQREGEHHGSATRT
jgi:hypothetical protein